MHENETPRHVRKHGHSDLTTQETTNPDDGATDATKILKIRWLFISGQEAGTSLYMNFLGIELILILN